MNTPTLDGCTNPKLELVRFAFSFFHAQSQQVVSSNFTNCPLQSGGV